ncbi:ABC transporter permease [Thermococcus gammatolerans]|uniref:Oligopeptide/dipeptide ABC transporter, permease protein (OppD/dppB) n=1 Tax=Thermococcus gammatolerans (strain DSM 15229 / JCM 11827 / EJ3) TaxID=593117 RepID=C5A565_THEGJ|nr:ABC transporter permease [Thermococcus gammatolerans]ACS33377.1 Oligopeptide/dipeptide ABC transporter, permease protein (oppD/dppB) [Thermococcus gammatolerans EJ3]
MANLRKFLVRRLLTFIPTIIGVTLIVFIIAYVIPADPARAWAGGEKATPEAIQKIKEQYHMNDPWYEQYWFLISGLAKNKIVDPRTSNYVFDDIGKRFPVTFELTLVAFFFILIIGLPLGILAALKRNTWVDTLVRIFALTGVSMPIFWLGYMLMYIFFVKWRVITLAGFPAPPAHEITHIPMIDALLTGDFKIFSQHLNRLWLPGLTLGFTGSGVLARFVRNSFLEALSSDYVAFLKAKGVPKLRIYRHALKNALVPILTVLGLQFGGLLGGTPITETVFGLPGMGSYVLDAIRNLDFPAVVAITFIFALIFVTTNLIVDILYAVVDPRVRY